MSTQPRAFTIKGALRSRVTKIAGVAVFVMLAVGQGPYVEARQQTYTFPFTALLNSGQEVPFNLSKAFGVAFVTYKWPSNEICFSISYEDNNLTSQEVAAHFHASAPPGQSAPIVIPLALGSPKNGCATEPLTGAQIGALFDGRWYLNIHTMLYPGGEIRGQVLPESVWY